LNNQITQPPATGARITVRGEDFLVYDVHSYAEGRYIVSGEGVSELVAGQHYTFDTALDDFEILAPENTQLIADQSSGYRKTKLFLETQLRNAYSTSEKITIADKAALNLAAYQLTPTTKALALPRARMLIADGVGLGKTIEVGILLAELMKRGRAQRILVLALKSILAQFQQEIWSRFSIPLVRLDSLGIARINAEIPASKNPFDYFDKTIISIDTLKNNARFQHYLEQTHWDVIVIDECHTVANMGSQRGKLANLLSTRCDSLIMTSATPHNGKRENFANLMTMLEPTAVPRNLEFDRESIGKYFVRRFKHDIDDDAVQANFREREVVATYTELLPEEENFLAWQQELKAREAAAGRAVHQFFSITLFKAYLSSPAAAKETLENKLERIATQIDADHANELEESVRELEEEYDRLEEGLALLQKVEAMAADSKLNAFVALLKRLGWRGKKNDERIVVFAERIATLTYLETALKEAFNLKDKVIQRFDGSLTDVEQQAVIEDFGTENSSIRLFLTSDAGSQGVNLHYFCHRMVNYDLPWSIITLDQRNGRIDRYGQQQTPYIHYLLAESGAAGVASDLHILERIREKEEEVKNTLGTVGTVLELYDSKREEDYTARAVAENRPDFLDQPAKATEEEEGPSGLDVLLSLINAEETADQPQEVRDLVDRDVSFYADDFAYYRELLEYLESVDAIDDGAIVIREDQIDVSPVEDLKPLLIDLPPEAKPRKGELFRLTTDPDVVMRSIANARSDAQNWSRTQLLYDLHPLAKYWMTKLETRIEKGHAPVAMVQQLAAGQHSYVFHGQVTNKLGRNVLSDFFVVTLNAAGVINRRPEPLEAFLETFGLTEALYTATVGEDTLAAVRHGLPLAIGFARELHMMPRQQELREVMARQQVAYQQELDHWFNPSGEELPLERHETPQADRSILDERSRFVTNMTSLEQEPYLRVLAVFVGKT
jgi:ERCC4-related helicase